MEGKLEECNPERPVNELFEFKLYLFPGGGKEGRCIDVIDVIHASEDLFHLPGGVLCSRIGIDRYFLPH